MRYQKYLTFKTILGAISRGFISLKIYILRSEDGDVMEDLEKNELLTTFGTSLRQLRLKAGLSQEVLADKSGLDRSYLGAIERGEHNVALLNILRISHALDLSPSVLLDCFKNQ